MADALHDPSESPRLDRLDNAPRLVRCVVQLPPCDPWHLAAQDEAARACGPVWARYHSPTEGLTFAACARLAGRALPHPEPVQAARAWFSMLTQDTITLGPLPPWPVPLALCAFPFDPATASHGGPFGAPGAGSIVVPGTLIVRSGPREAPQTVALLHALCPRGSDLKQVRAQFAAREAALRRVAHAIAPAVPQKPTVPAPRVPEMAHERTAFMARVQGARAAIAEGALHKVVLARSQAMPGQVDVVRTAWALRDSQPESTAFHWALGDGAHFVGATPETLVRLHGGHISTEALAGTARRHADAEADQRAGEALLNSTKDRHEHQLVVAAITRALSPLAACAPMREQPELLRLRQVWHLHTPVRGAVRPGVDVLHLVAALHPTPALGGAPQSLALAHLKKHEPWCRGLYAAPLGYITLEKEGAFVAAIRSAWCGPDRVHLFAGAGIVAASDALAEWHETCLKMTTVARALQFEAAVPASKEPA